MKRPESRVGIGDYFHHAVCYPEIIALTSLLASPIWRANACSHDAANYNRFSNEVIIRLVPDLHPADGLPPLKAWRRSEMKRFAVTGKTALHDLPTDHTLDETVGSIAWER